MCRRKLSVRFDKVEPDPPRRSDRLPEGLHGVGMGLGVDGQPLHDVRENLPSPADMGNIGAAPNMGPSNAANVGTAALQAALATIMGMGGMGSGFFSLSLAIHPFYGLDTQISKRKRT